MAYITSIVGSSVVGFLSMFPNNRLLYSKYSAIIMAFKSLIFVDMHLSDIIHHFLTLIICFYYLYYTSKQNNDFTKLVEEVYIIQQINISSYIFRNSPFQKKSVHRFFILLTFGYYRGIFVYHYFIKGFDSIYDLCPNNSYTCVYILDKTFFLLSILNIYWFILIVRKANHRLKQLS